MSATHRLTPDTAATIFAQRDEILGEWIDTLLSEPEEAHCQVMLYAHLPGKPVQHCALGLLGQVLLDREILHPDDLLGFYDTSDPKSLSVTWGARLSDEIYHAAQVLLGQPLADNVFIWNDGMGILQILVELPTPEDVNNVVPTDHAWTFREIAERVKEDLS